MLASSVRAGSDTPGGKAATMKHIPRASLLITILDDEDYHELLAEPQGLEAFGLFVALVLVARERLQQEKAVRIGKTDALRFENASGFVAGRAGVDVATLARSLQAMASVAERTGTEPWVHLDADGRIVIRSFFRYNTKTGWGGTRAGSGRPRKNQINQDDSRENHLEITAQRRKKNQVGIKKNQDDIPSKTILNTTWFPPGSGSGSGSDCPVGQSTDRPTVVPESAGSHQEAVELAMELFGDTAADALSRSKLDIESMIQGVDGRPRWDCYAAALRLADLIRRKPGAEPIRSLNGFCLDRAREWVVTGIPPGPVAVPNLPSRDSRPLPPPVVLDEARRLRFTIPSRQGAGYNGFPQSGRDHGGDQ